MSLPHTSQGAIPFSAQGEAGLALAGLSSELLLAVVAKGAGSGFSEDM